MAEFNGKVFPVNPKASVIHSIKSYSTVLDVPDPVDLAIVIVPKDFVKEVIIQCGEKGVKGGRNFRGFSESDPKEGRRRFCRKYVDSECDRSPVFG
jgi:acyl-CoA synthetase (NDP forming)